MSETTTHVLSVDIPSGWHVELGDQYHTGLSVISCLFSCIIVYNVSVIFICNLNIP